MEQYVEIATGIVWTWTINSVDGRHIYISSITGKKCTSKWESVENIESDAYTVIDSETTIEDMRRIGDLISKK